MANVDFSPVLYIPVRDFPSGGLAAVEDAGEGPLDDDCPSLVSGHVVDVDERGALLAFVSTDVSVGCRPGKGS